MAGPLLYFLLGYRARRGPRGREGPRGATGAQGAAGASLLGWATLEPPTVVTVATSDWTDVLSVDVEMPASGNILVEGGMGAISQGDPADLGVRVTCNGTALRETRQPSSFGDGVNGFAVVTSKATAQASSTATVKLQFIRHSGDGTLRCDPTGTAQWAALKVWALPADPQS